MQRWSLPWACMNIYVRKCKKFTEESNRNNVYVRKCKTEERKPKLSHQTTRKRTLPRSYSVSSSCVGDCGEGGRGIGAAVDVVTTPLLSWLPDAAVATTAMAASVDVQSCSSNLEQVVVGGGLARGDGGEGDAAGLSGAETIGLMDMEPDK